MCEIFKLSFDMLMYVFFQGTTMIQDTVLAITDHAVLPISAVFNAIKEIKHEGCEQTDPLVITQAASIGVSLFCYSTIS